VEFVTSIRVKITIDQFIGFACRIIEVGKKATLKRGQAVRRPMCAAGPSEKCQLCTGQPRTEPHCDRHLMASRLSDENLVSN